MAARRCVRLSSPQYQDPSASVVRRHHRRTRYHHPPTQQLRWHHRHNNPAATTKRRNFLRALCARPLLSGQLAAPRLQNNHQRYLSTRSFSVGEHNINDATGEELSSSSSSSSSSSKVVSYVEENFAGHRLHLESGIIAPIADGAVLATYGECSVLCTAVGTPNENLEDDAVNLNVDFINKSFARGILPSNMRRSDFQGGVDIPVSRAVDRALRPLFPKGGGNHHLFDCQVVF